jgi:integrase
MPHFPKPFWRKDRNRWMLQLPSGTIVTLGPDKDKAFRKYHEIMASQAGESRQSPSASANDPTVASILDQFLEWVAKNRKPRTYETYQERLQLFLSDLEDPKILVSHIKPYHITKFVGRHPNWSATMRRGRMQAVQTALDWAVKEGLIDQSPLAKLQKPSPGRRDNPVTEVDHLGILAVVKGEGFRDLLTLAWETGARPQEIVRAEARHLDRNLSALVFPPEEAKGNRWRAVYLSPTARALVEKLAERYPSGPLLRNSDGVGWTPFAVSCAFGRAQKKMGKRFALYDYRHGWATSALERGIDPVTVSVLMGHADPSMLCRVYQHMSRNTANLRATVGKVRATPEGVSVSSGSAASEPTPPEPRRRSDRDDSPQGPPGG